MTGGAEGRYIRVGEFVLGSLGMRDGGGGWVGTVRTATGRVRIEECLTLTRALYILRSIYSPYYEYILRIYIS